MYWRRHGVERPATPSQFPATERPCTHCGQLTRTPRRGWCPTCYTYWLKHSAMRSLLPRPLPACQTCGQLVQEGRRGRCSACYSYWYRTGRERPTHLWQRD